MRNNGMNPLSRNIICYSNSLFKKTNYFLSFRQRCLTITMKSKVLRTVQGKSKNNSQI